MIATSLAIHMALDIQFVGKGISAQMGYMPIRGQLKAGTPAGATIPSGLTSPRWTTFTFGNSSFDVILDTLGSGSKIYVDSNGDHDFTNDETPVWAGRKSGDYTMFSGTCEVTLPQGKATLGIYKFDESDPQRAQLKDIILYYSDFGYKGSMTFGNENLNVQVAGSLAEGSRVWVDRNKNGKSDGRSESLAIGSAFNFGGTTYEFQVSGMNLKVVESEKSVAEVPMPPDLSVGKDAPKFSAKSVEGKSIEFPSTYKGKIVMIDFWATWCGPCIKELPNVIAAYQKYHEKGFEVLGISFDKENMESELNKFTKEHNMPWPQVYEGKFWETTIGTQFGVEAIPFCLLVDGSTGKILATVDKLRGENLDKTLAEVMATREKGHGVKSRP